MIELDPTHQAVADEARNRISKLIGSSLISEIEQPIPEVEE